MSGKCKYVVGLLLCIIACMQLTSCKTEKYDLFTTLSGFVLDKATSEPLDGVTITLSPGGKNMVTGADGFLNLTTWMPNNTVCLPRKAVMHQNGR